MPTKVGVLILKAQVTPMYDLDILKFPTIRGQVIERIDEWNSRIDTQCTTPNSFRVPITSQHAVNQYARCRKCVACKKWRTGIWATRTKNEFHSHQRTWWVTYTYRGRRSISYEDVKLSFKRLRKKHKFRYVISEEKGEKNERLHYHAILHCDDSLKRRDIEGSWSGYGGNGFAHCRLARSEKLGSYLAKYLAKESRIRASKHYGNFELALYRAKPELEGPISRWIRTGYYCPSLPQGIRLTTQGIQGRSDALRRDIPPF